MEHVRLVTDEPEQTPEIPNITPIRRARINLAYMQSLSSLPDNVFMIRPPVEPEAA